MICGKNFSSLCLLQKRSNRNFCAYISPGDLKKYRNLTKAQHFISFLFGKEEICFIFFSKIGLRYSTVHIFSVESHLNLAHFKRGWTKQKSIHSTVLQGFKSRIISVTAINTVSIRCPLLHQTPYTVYF